MNAFFVDIFDAFSHTENVLYFVRRIVLMTVLFHGFEIRLSYTLLLLFELFRQLSISLDTLHFGGTGK